MEPARLRDDLIAHYLNSFNVFHRFPDQHSIAPTSRSPTVATFRQFVAWLLAGPLERPARSQRSEEGVHHIVKDLRTYVRFLHREGLLEKPIEVPVPKAPQHRFPHPDPRGAEPGLELLLHPTWSGGVRLRCATAPCSG